MAAIHVGSITNRDALLQVIDGLKAESYTPLAETLFEAMRYFKGEKSAFRSNTYTSPITASCQQTYVILITDGMPTKDNNDVLRSICGNGDCDKDSKDVSTDSSDYLDDVAKYIHDIDLSEKYAGTQNAYTYTIGFGAIAADKAAVKLLEDTAANGGGVPYLASNYQNLASALSTIIGKILEVNSAFVAPVVPTSPENKTYSGERVYLGFFKPVANGDWRGNLKKFGLVKGEVVDKTGAVATDANGKFDPDAISFWSVNPDGGNVDEGGVGELLAKRDLVSNPRKIYTITGNGTVLNPIKKDLTSAENAVKLDNTKLTTTLLGVSATTDREKIIRYITGWDAYDQDLDGNTSEKRPWILGDILHSKPLIQSYNSYSLADEGTSANKTVIYVGSNDGQLHAFSDATGEELWSFIPPIFLPNLQQLGNNIHNYFIDASPIPFVYDANNDGTIDAVAGDKVIILFGLRRGAGVDTLDPTLNRGAYYALDVSDPANPALLWELTGKTSGFEELGESWSDPVVGKMRLGGSDRFVAIIGAGYDTNEDLRYGSTQTFPDGMGATTETTLKANDFGDVFSVGSSKQFTPKGRGIYIVEIGQRDLSSGKVKFNDTPVKLWGYTEAYATASGTDKANIPTYSFPSSVAAIDSNFDSYIDVIYAGDTGGNMWRFRVADKVTTGKWTGTKVFSANPSDKLISGDDPPTNGRRILYPPSVVLEQKYNGVYFGTGDRAHALNTGVTDRLYAFYDRGFYDSSYDTTVKTEANLVNVTEDSLQSATMTAPNCSDPTDTSIECVLERLNSPKYSGWFIKLDQNKGEKVLAPALVVYGKAYYTTFTPNAVSADVDPCLSGNLGVSRLYVVDYLTGEAVLNFYEANDSENTSNLNKRAGIVNVDDKGVLSASGTGAIFRREDRSRILGSGIASGAVIAIKEDGTSAVLIGCGGGICTEEPPPSMTSWQIYWMME
ncbi:pilus assembly protein [Desulfuromonas sp. DDH964]|uniref:PilC/PilY family type IV pilus protein n=1 Tax=Desulfuromonas sp. DDH964 TaxID=1823759 RepID=UPI001E412C05|nr:PilC/PilY family type IV pilus protein [Desulfuromonas sp. DDH964]